MATSNESLLEFAISHAVGLQRYGTNVVKKVLEVLNEADQEIEQELTKRLAQIKQRGYDLSPANTERLKILQKQIRAITAASYQTAYGIITDELKQLIRAEAGRSVEEFERALKVRLGAVVPAPAVLAAMVRDPVQGASVRDWLRGIERNKQDKIMSLVRLGITTNQTLPEIVARIAGTADNNFRDGALEISRRQTEALVRTVVNFISNRAREEVFNQNAWLLNGVKWVSTLDTRTTPVCRARDGKVYPLNAGPRPPAHFRCRSVIVGMTKSWEELANTTLPDSDETLEERFRNELRARGFSEQQINKELMNARASMNGLVPEDLTYGDWLRRQPASVQDEVLGKVRGKLFRQGKLSIDRFVDDNGRSFTLEELRSREREAFEKAGLL